MPRPLKVFLCHAHSDKDAVKFLYGRLKREGVDVWLDKEKLLPGADWEYEIRKAVRESDVVIVCLSKQFNQAGFRQKEVRIALEEADRKPEGEIFIIPARLEECDNLENLSKWHWVDLFKSDGFQRLILALRIRANRIGATLRQRGTTISRQKKNEEQQDTGKEQIEIARRDAEEQEQQKLAKEQAERAENERAERERLERALSEKAVLEKAEREAAERLTREKDAAEKHALEKAEREKKESEIAERINRGKTELAQARQEEKQKLERPMQQPQKPVLEPAVVVERKQPGARKPATITNLRRLGIGGIIFASLLIVIFTGNYLIETLVPTQFIDPDVIMTNDTTATQAAVFTNAAFIAATNAENTAYAMQTLTSLPTFTPTPTPGIGSTQVSKMDDMVMVFVPAGKFTMGSDTNSDEQPIHQVDLDAFWIDQTEVTNAMYAKCVADGDCGPPSSSSSYTHDSYYGNSIYDDYPVIYVN